jgi:hypothetical protein
MNNTYSNRIFWGITVGLISLIALYFVITIILGVMTNAGMIYLTYSEKIIVILSIFVVSALFSASIILKTKFLRVISLFLLLLVAIFVVIGIIKIINIPVEPIK